MRSGKHCAKMGDNKEDTVRISLYFYNNYEEIDYLISVLKKREEIFLSSSKDEEKSKCLD